MMIKAMAAAVARIARQSHPARLRIRQESRITLKSCHARNL